MMIKFFMFLVLMSTTSFSQNFKPTHYIDSDFNRLDYQRFYELLKDRGVYFAKTFENDTIRLKMLIQRKKKEKLSKQELDEVKNSLDMDKLPSAEMIVIYYYPGWDECNKNHKSWMSDVYVSKKYHRKLRKIATYNHFWVYKNDDNLVNYSLDKIDWRKDKDQILEKFFFKSHYPCNSTVVIDKDGNYISILGESGPIQILEIAKELIEVK